MRYNTSFSDEEIVEALVHADLHEDRLWPPNLRTFYSNLPKPEKMRILEVARKQWNAK